DDAKEIFIGRDPECDFSVDEVVISRRHAKIGKQWGGISLIDLDSKYGCFVNHRRVVEEFLHDGDRIALGTILLLFRNPQEINLKEIGEEIVRSQPAPATSREAARGGGSDGFAVGGGDASPYDKKEQTEESSEVSDMIRDLPTLQPAAANNYPSMAMTKEKRLTPMEIGMIGLGIIIFSFATITLVNLILE
ncbi:MAG: FHA domain-containing protein, partial [Deltaproteobacteria bacterium]|nr:FHA domain-containing protein [Deltaproteobacteria bacterium]